MKKCLTLFFLCFSIIQILAQPVNDDCGGIIDLGVAPYCPGNVYFTNVGATESDIGNDNIPTPGSCSENDIFSVDHDVWFQFTASDTILDYVITVTGEDDMANGVNGLLNPQIMVYRGVCGSNTLALLTCGAVTDDNELSITAVGLDPGVTYYIRVNNAYTDIDEGSFLLCIDEIAPPTTIDEDGSTACEGELYDTGGPNGDYSNTEDNAFTICPPSNENSCVTFNLEFFNIEVFEDELIFYDGPDTDAPVINAINGNDAFIGETNNGGVCYSVQASSGCLTVRMTTDNMTTFEGFAGFWECSAEPCVPIGTVSVDSEIDDQTLINAITAPQTTVTIDTIICASDAYGTFAAADNSDLGLDKGIILTSGSVINALGPNFEGGRTEQNFTLGDSDLDYLSGLSGDINLSEDACIVELDVFAGTDELKFEYIFGSEEYPEYVNNGFNDIFAFLISGPGITGDPNIADQENIALIPETTTPIEINTVNNVSNWEYYRFNGNGQTIEYDGLTSDFLGVKKSLTATKTVLPCNTFHLKLAIADRGDGAWDSGVFVGEIGGKRVDVTAIFNSGVDYLAEACTGVNDRVEVTLSETVTEPTTFDVLVMGSAIRDLDYMLDMPDQITFLPNQTTMIFPIIPLSDAFMESPEDIIIILTQDFGCGDIELGRVEIDLFDTPNVEILGGQDTVLFCAGESAILSVEGANTYTWSPAGIFDDPTIQNPTVTPPVSQFVEVSGSVGTVAGCTDTDSIWLQVIDPSLDIIPMGALNVCEGERVMLEAVNNINSENIRWSPATGLNSVDRPLVIATPEEGSFLYTASVSLDGCFASDTIRVNVSSFEFPALVEDITICEGESIQLAANIPPFETTTVYSWTPTNNLTPSATISGPTASPSVSTTYQLIASSPDMLCQDTALVNVNVVPASVSLTPQQDTLFICNGELAMISAVTTSGIVNWSPTDGISDPTDLDISINTTTSQWYTASMSTAFCSAQDSIYVQVDQIPNIPIESLSGNSPYCEGEVVTLISPEYDPSDYPTIMHQWSPAVDAISDLDNLNLIINANQTRTYTRVTTLNACSQVDEITIEVQPLVEALLEWTDTIVCPGDTLQLPNLIPLITDVEWSVDGEFVGTGTAVIITPETSAIYTIDYVDNCGNSFTDEVEVTVRETVDLAITADQPTNDSLSEGTFVNLEATIDPAQDGGTFEWNTGQMGPTAADTLITIPQEIFEVTYTDENGCKIDASITFLVKELGFDIPNIFTPNNDGTSDYFNAVYNPNIEILSFKIWSRWGEQVYDNENPTLGWDGKKGGENMPSDVYMVRIEYRLPTGMVMNVTGDLTLVR